MDTRSKIVPAEEAARAIAEWCAAGEPPAVVTGYFDPLLAVHAMRLSEAARGRRLVVALRDPADPILPARARAELVAALGDVTLVVLAQEGGDIWSGAIPQEEADAATREEFVEHVRRRNAG